MIKCVKNGNSDVAEYVIKEYKVSRGLCLSMDYQLYAPIPRDIFEITDQLEWPDYENDSYPVLEPGIYMVVEHIGWIWDDYYPIIISKYENGAWGKNISITIAIDENFEAGKGAMIDWRGTRSTSIQYDLPL